MCLSTIRIVSLQPFSDTVAEIPTNSNCSIPKCSQNPDRQITEAGIEGLLSFALADAQMDKKASPLMNTQVDEFMLTMLTCNVK
jgi:hypothetical protein